MSDNTFETMPDEVRRELEEAAGISSPEAEASKNQPEPQSFENKVEEGFQVVFQELSAAKEQMQLLTFQQAVLRTELNGVVGTLAKVVKHFEEMAAVKEEAADGKA